MSTPSWPTTDDLHDLQGDVVLGFPKRNENFLFFAIQDASAFKQGLKQLIPSITTTAQVQQFRKDVEEHKKQGKHDLLKFSGINIGFTKQGFTKLGITESLNDSPFDAGQLANAQALGDEGTTDSDGKFEPKWLDGFKAEIDGILLIAGECKETVLSSTNQVEHLLGSSIKQILLIPGQVRPGKEKGHEHFGFMDGISAPAIETLTGHLPGQIVVDPGVLICGTTGDVDGSGNPVSRPSWAKNGSFLVYRQLEQLVPEFAKFLHDNPLNFPAIPREQGSELLGARMIGRWKSGAPIALAPFEDDDKLAKDPKKNNDFTFGGNDLLDQTKCPFSAHIRKTNPRADLQGSQFPKNALTQHMIARQGIPFGPEVTHEEARCHTTKIDRGLAFACYQSNLSNGFEFVQKLWANNVNFPPKTINNNPYQTGFDPIVGQNGGAPRQSNGLQPRHQNVTTTLASDFVVSKGGAYFFVPSVSALKEKLAE